MGLAARIKSGLTAFWHSLTPDGIKCVYCGRELTPEDKGGLCGECLRALPLAGNRICKKCGCKIGAESAYCERCPDNRHNFDACRSACEFSGLSRQLVHRLKFGGERYLAKYMAYFMSGVFKNQEWEIDAATYVPMTAKALKKRGYNQARLLAAEFCAIVSLPLSGCLEKSKETSNQAYLNYKERMENIKNAYQIIDKQAVKGKNILVIDDVKTTGATLDEIAAALKRSGAGAVYGLTFASRTQKADLGEN